MGNPQPLPYPYMFKSKEDAAQFFVNLANHARGHAKAVRLQSHLSTRHIMQELAVFRAEAAAWDMAATVISKSNLVVERR